jgi:hypothetical protein
MKHDCLSNNISLFWLEPRMRTCSASGDSHGHHLVALQLRYHTSELQPFQRQRIHGRHGKLPIVAKVY